MVPRTMWLFWRYMCDYYRFVLIVRWDLESAVRQGIFLVRLIEWAKRGQHLPVVVPIEGGKRENSVSACWRAHLPAAAQSLHCCWCCVLLWHCTQPALLSKVDWRLVACRNPPGLRAWLVLLRYLISWAEWTITSYQSLLHIDRP